MDANEARAEVDRYSRMMLEMISQATHVCAHGELWDEMRHLLDARRYIMKTMLPPAVTANEKDPTKIDVGAGTVKFADGTEVPVESQEGVTWEGEPHGASVTQGQRFFLKED